MEALTTSEIIVIIILNIFFFAGSLAEWKSTNKERTPSNEN